MFLKEEKVSELLKKDSKTKILCKKCSTLTAVYTLNDESGETCDPAWTEYDMSKCDRCKLIIRSYYTGKEIQPSPSKAKAPLLSLPSKSLFMHINDNLLNAHEPPPQIDTSLYRNKNVLLIGCGGIKRMTVLLTICKLGLNKLVCLARERDWATPLVDDWIVAEHENIDKKAFTLDKIREYITFHDMTFDAIFTYDDYCTLMTSFLANAFGLASIPFETCSRIKNKNEFRKLSTELGISAPKFFKIDFNKREEFVDEIRDGSKSVLPARFPVIVKNPVGSGKDFVQKCSSLEELSVCILKSMSVSSRMDLLIEEYFDGHEIDLEMLVQDNKVKFVAISDNTPPIEPYFYEQGGACPSIELSQQEQEAIRSLSSKWVSRLNIQNACLHFEGRCRPQSLYKDRPVFDENCNIIDENWFLMPIEINLRLAGAETWSMIKAVYDVDLLREHLNISLGFTLVKEQFDHKLENPRFKCISKDIHPARECLLSSILIDLGRLHAEEKLCELSIFRSPGDNLSREDYVGWFTVKADLSESNDALVNSINKIFSIFKIEFSDL